MQRNEFPDMVRNPVMGLFGTLLVGLTMASQAAYTVIPMIPFGSPYDAPKGAMNNNLEVSSDTKASVMH